MAPVLLHSRQIPDKSPLAQLIEQMYPSAKVVTGERHFNDKIPLDFADALANHTKIQAPHLRTLKDIVFDGLANRTSPKLPHVKSLNGVLHYELANDTIPGLPQIKPLRDIISRDLPTNVVPVIDYDELPHHQTALQQALPWICVVGGVVAALLLIVLISIVSHCCSKCKGYRQHRKAQLQQQSPPPPPAYESQPPDTPPTGRSSGSSSTCVSDNTTDNGNGNSIPMKDLNSTSYDNNSTASNNDNAAIAPPVPVPPPFPTPNFSRRVPLPASYCALTRKPTPRVRPAPPRKNKVYMVNYSRPGLSPAGKQQQQRIPRTIYEDAREREGDGRLELVRYVGEGEGRPPPYRP